MYNKFDLKIIFVPVGVQLANGQFEYNPLPKVKGIKILRRKDYPSWTWACGGASKNRLSFQVYYYQMLNYRYAWNLQITGRIHKNPQLLEYYELMYSGMNADDHMQHLDSVKENCNPRCQIGLVSGNTTQCWSDCFRHGWACHRHNKCISSCGCEDSYSDISRFLRITLDVCKEINTQTFATESLDASQLTSVLYDDAFIDWCRIRRIEKQNQPIGKCRRTSD